MSFGKKKSVFGQAPVRRDASNLHRHILSLAQQIYTGFTILEEQQIECRVDGRTTSLPVDIVIKNLRVAIEIHGQQHYKYIQHFHRSESGFEAQKARDAAKERAIRECGWTYLAVKFDEVPKMTVAKLTKLISKAMKE
jgi:very-short-patch-repair endonuclease